MNSEMQADEFLRELRDRAQAIAVGWGTKTAEEQILVLVEEVGELSRALIKRKQGIRQATDWDAEVAKEACDVIISLMAIVGLEDIDFYPILTANLERVEERQRAHLADPSDESGWAPTSKSIHEIYEQSQVVDPWPGDESYKGTSLKTGVEVLKTTVETLREQVEHSDLITTYGDEDDGAEWWFECRVCGVAAGYDDEVSMLKDATTHTTIDCADELEGA